MSKKTPTFVVVNIIYWRYTMKKRILLLLALLCLCFTYGLAADWSGTGWALKDGYVVTNHHVVDGANRIVCKFQRSGRLFEYDAEVVATDEEHDLALIHITSPSFPGFGELPYAVKTTLANVGIKVYVLGYPLTDTMGDEIKLTDGLISAQSGYKGDVSLYQISAPIQPGNSGGPLFDKWGNVIGIVCAMHTQAENANYAVKSTHLVSMIWQHLGSIDIIPQENHIASLELEDQVKRIKDFVCYIECSSRPTATNPYSTYTTPSPQGQYSNYDEEVMTEGRSFIRECITSWGECRNVAITETNGDLALHGRNGWAGKGLPVSLSNALTELNDDNKYINDVQLTENGNWIILYGSNGFRWEGIPQSLEKKIREYNANNEEVTSVTFNDSGDWIVITTEHYASSDSRITEWLKAGAKEFGLLWAACITENGMVACYKNGYKFFGDIPSELRNRLQETDLNVYRIKIAGESYFFADEDGHYRYKM